MLLVRLILDKLSGNFFLLMKLVCWHESWLIVLLGLFVSCLLVSLMVYGMVISLQSTTKQVSGRVSGNGTTQNFVVDTRSSESLHEVTCNANITPGYLSEHFLMFCFVYI